MRKYQVESEVGINILSENPAEENSVYKLPQNSQNLKHVQQQQLVSNSSSLMLNPAIKTPTFIPCLMHNHRFYKKLPIRFTPLITQKGQFQLHLLEFNIDAYSLPTCQNY